MSIEASLSIPEFYRGRCIFLTGATGFMGKVLVYKLLKDCGDLERIYLLMRAKKGAEPKQRLEEYVNHMVSFTLCGWWWRSRTEYLPSGSAVSCRTTDTFCKTIIAIGR